MNWTGILITLGLWLASAVIVSIALARAAMGYEDSTGYHDGEPDQ